MRRNFRRAWFILLCPALVAGCSIGKSRRPNELAGGAPQVRSTIAGDLPAPTVADFGNVERQSVIGPLDKIIVDVLGITELSQREIQVDAGGHISFPLIGSVDVAGKTPVEVAAIIRTRLREQYIRDPQVTVNLRETVSQIVTVDGEVREPGSYPIIGRMTLLRAIATAKGTTEFARQSRVLVFRTVDGQRLAGLYDLKSIRQGVYRDPEIYMNDIVVVGDNAARRLLRDALGIFPVVSTPIILLLTR